MTMVSNGDDGDASKDSGLQNVAKFPRLEKFSLNELDNVGMLLLAQAKDRLGDMQSSRAGSDDVERETTRVFKLEMTLETLQAEVVDDECSSEVLEINKEIAIMDEIIPILNACVDFVNAMSRKIPIHLQVPAPKVPPPNAEISQVPDSCSACGLLMYDEEAMGYSYSPANMLTTFIVLPTLLAERENAWLQVVVMSSLIISRN
ncbi:hypothetical protein L7F22_033725 [Adiantum nelumboides]|nr:hypothetical protein [Adiantum nelumboides]